MKVCVIIPAAGQSERFGQVDKLAQDLGGRPLLVRTVEVFTKREEVTSIIVAGPPDEFDTFKTRYGATLGFHGAVIVEGGKTARWETVQRALEHVPKDVTHIAVHDAARPGPSKEMLDRVFETAEELQAVIPGLEVQSTLKCIDENEIEVNPSSDDDALAEMILGDAGKKSIQARRVQKTIDRDNLFAIQTPQVFQVELLKRAYQQDLHELNVTDDASLVEILGETVHVVEGDAQNIKVTTPADLSLMRALMGVKPPKERPVHKRF